MRIRSVPMREVQVWELPVRIYHWVNALCILSLCITGYIIGSPPAFMRGTEAYFNFWFGTVQVYPFCYGICLLLQFPGPYLLGICRK